MQSFLLRGVCAICKYYDSLFPQPMQYHPRKAVPKTAAPIKAVYRPIIEFGGIEGLFFIGGLFYGLFGNGLSDT